VRIARFAGTTALVVLTARQVAYALAPQPSAAALQHAVGGPGLVVTTLVVLSLGLGLACAVLWLASLGVRERHLLSGERSVAPRIRPARTLVHAFTFAAAGCFAFAALESYVHWRAGMGFHGLHCLTGPVHRNVVPIICSLALLAAALRAALQHVLAWIRRTIALLRARRVGLARAPLLRRGPTRTAFPSLLVSRIRVRGPPRVAVFG
jgi:hypothetical protein